MPRFSFPKPYADWAARLRVPAGFLLVAIFAWRARPAWKSIAWGLPLSLVGLWLRAWAAGHLAKNIRLARSGPYAWHRNPLYVGTLLVAAGMVVAARDVPLAALFAAIFLCVYLPVIQLEEQHLAKLFPEFGEYISEVPLLLPRPPRRKSPNRFSWSLYWKNEEYKALFAFLAAALWLCWRAARG